MNRRKKEATKPFLEGHFCKLTPKSYLSSTDISSTYIWGGGGGPDPPYKNSHHRKTDFLLVQASFLVKFRQPERSSWVKLTGET